ncbi:uncharacterized protein LOC117641566 isoform X2 [Thrips palmi]|uniref:Uncharacterized protein LOC117641566 isoform X2 n=1 Tax=Thrips palmi TaxID=161013 RepID=A0A6P8YLN0_THRPL|nr:uncharacterized protein LOC117641566 isoform X2 [Thrips palmi]
MHRGLFDAINILNGYFDIYCNKATSGVHEHLIDSLQVERNQLNENLMKLRANYQQHQVDTMAKLGTTQRYQGNQFSDLCSKFEATSGILAENIKNLIDQYMEKSDKYLQDFEEKTMEHHNIIVETMEHLSREFSENTILKIEQEVLHISKYYYFDLPPSTALFSYKGISPPERKIEQ